MASDEVAWQGVWAVLHTKQCYVYKCILMVCDPSRLVWCGSNLHDGAEVDAVRVQSVAVPQELKRSRPGGAGRNAAFSCIGGLGVMRLSILISERGRLSVSMRQIAARASDNDPAPLGLPRLESSSPRPTAWAVTSRPFGPELDRDDWLERRFTMRKGWKFSWLVVRMTLSGMRMFLAHSEFRHTMA
jgi:hypothetical protein